MATHDIAVSFDFIIRLLLLFYGHLTIRHRTFGQGHESATTTIIDNTTAVSNNRN